MAMRNKLKGFLESQNITVYRFYKDLGVSPKTAYDLVNDPSKLPSAIVLDKICSTYKMQPGVFIEWVEE